MASKEMEARRDNLVLLVSVACKASVGRAAFVVPLAPLALPVLSAFVARQESKVSKARRDSRVSVETQGPAAPRAMLAPSVLVDLLA